MVLDPVNRASRWRYDSSAPTDYDDSQAFCGGFYVSLSSNLNYIRYIIETSSISHHILMIKIRSILLRYKIY